MPPVLSWKLGALPCSGSVCRKSPMVTLPVSWNSSRVITVTGAGVVRSLRRMRDPVTTISSSAVRLVCSGGGGAAVLTGAGGGVAAGGAAEPGGCCGGGVSCPAALLAPQRIKTKEKATAIRWRKEFMCGPLRRTYTDAHIAHQRSFVHMTPPVAVDRRLC